MTWGEFAWMVEGHRLREIEEWKRTRAILQQQYNKYAKTQIKDPEKFMPLESERKELPKVYKKAPNLKGLKSRKATDTELKKLAHGI